MKKNNSKKLKENPIMGNQKEIKNLKMTNSEEEGNEIKSFLIILVVICVIVGGIYALTEVFKKDDDKKSDEPAVEAGSINYDKVNVGMILNRPYDAYYVLVYNSEDSKAVLYSTMMSSYMKKSSEDDYLKIYYCDLNNSLNKDYYNVNNDGKSNKSAKKVEDFNFGDLTLLKVEKGKITKYIEDYEEIKQLLK